MPLDDSTSHVRYAADLPIALMRDDPDNPRKDLGDVAAMGESIRQLGVLQPIVVREDPQPDQVILYTVVFGHRRKHGCAAIGRETIPALVVPQGVDIHSPAVLQAAENLARLPMTPVETWRRVQQLQDAMGLNEAQTAAALMVDRRMLRRLTLLGRVHPPLLEAMERTGEMPEWHELAKIAAAHPDEQKAAWKRHGPKKPGQRVIWRDVSWALRRERIARKKALFGPELAAKHKVVWEEDLFEQPEDAFHTTHTGRFVAAQAEWLKEVCLPALRVHGYKAELLKPDTYGQLREPAGSVRIYDRGDKPLWEAGGLAKEIARGFAVNPRTGEVDAIAYRPVPKAAEKGKAAAAGASAAPALPISKRGLERIEEVKRRAAAHGVMACTDPDRLLGVALLLLREKMGGVVPPVTTLLDQQGRLDVAASDFRGRAVAAAHGVLGAILERRVYPSYQAAGAGVRAVERIGAGLDETPAWEATEQELALLKAPALKEIADALEIAPRGTGKATREVLLHEKGADGRLVLGPGELKALAWAPEAPDASDEGPNRDEDDEEDGPEPEAVA